MSKAESVLARFIKTELAMRLEPKLRKLGFPAPCEEKYLAGNYYDVYAYSRSWRCVTLWEIEAHSRNVTYNVKKLKTVMAFRWKPRVFMFHVVSPFYSQDVKDRCLELAGHLDRKFPDRFRYLQIDLDVEKEVFEMMLRSFESNKYRARQQHGRKLARELNRVASASIDYLLGEITSRKRIKFTR